MEDWHSKKKKDQFSEKTNKFDKPLMKLIKKQREVTKKYYWEWMDAAHIETKTRRYYKQIFAGKYGKLYVMDKFLENHNWFKKIQKTLIL